MRPILPIAMILLWGACAFEASDGGVSNAAPAGDTETEVRLSAVEEQLAALLDEIAVSKLESPRILSERACTGPLGCDGQNRIHRFLVGHTSHCRRGGTLGVNTTADEVEAERAYYDAWRAYSLWPRAVALAGGGKSATTTSVGWARCNYSSTAYVEACPPSNGT